MAACRDAVQRPVLAGCAAKRAPRAGLDHQWGLELYGKLLEAGGGKERMTAYFTVRVPTQPKASDALQADLSREACTLASLELPVGPGVQLHNCYVQNQLIPAIRPHAQQTLRAQPARALSAGARR